MIFKKGNVRPNRKLANLDCRTFRISAIPLYCCSGIALTAKR